MATTSRRAPVAPVRSLKRVGLWGAPGSGKSTFLAALNIAVTQSPEDLLIFGVDEPSTDFLVENTALLTQRRFPPATELSTPLSWTLHLNTEVKTRTRLGRQVQTTVPLSFNIDLLDVPGRLFGSVPGMESSGLAVAPPPVAAGAALGFDDDDDDVAAPAEPTEDLLDHLASCDGIVLLFDPIREWTAGDAYYYFQGALLRIAQRRLGERAQAGQKLPQYVAVCVTKFDDPNVYRRARKGGFRTFSVTDDRMFPQVPEETAKEFFTDLCRQAELGNAELIPSALEKYFQASRIRFFVTSAIGFYLNKRSSRFQEHDFQNVVEGDGGSRIRGQIYPINVVEPLLWLGQCLAQG